MILNQNKMKKFLFAFVLITTQAFSQTKLADGMYANFVTKKGTITTQLYFNETPLTVANFVALAEGTHPKSESEYNGQFLYNGLQFHLVIANFMIQGGDPIGDGCGERGYLFADHIVPTLNHHVPGVLSMANHGAVTNGSQSVITH